MIKSPLRYPGGKSRAVQLIAKLVPPYEEFREPFVGGGSVFLYLKQKYPQKKYWINDLYKQLFLFWKMSQKDIHQVIDQVYDWRYRFKVGKELHKFLTTNIGSFNEWETAAAFFIFNRITFSGTSESGGFSNMAFSGRFTESSIKRLIPFARSIQDTTITNYDFQEVIETEGTDVFIFLDPPYHSATKSALYGKNGRLHKGFDHVRLADVMKNSKHKWLITYDDSEYIRNLYSFANIISWDLMYGMRNVNKGSNQLGKELFISNYLEPNTNTIFNRSSDSLFECIY
jgi:DNA adenine methylase